MVEVVRDTNSVVALLVESNAGNRAPVVLWADPTTHRLLTDTSVTMAIDDALKADDAAFVPGTTKVLMAGFEFDDTTPDSVDEGDAGAARMSSRRELYTQIRDAAGNERGLNVTARNSIFAEGPTAADLAVAAAPMTIGGRASAAEPTAVSTDGDVVNAWLDLKGRQIVAFQCGAAAHTNVNDTASSTTLLAANTARKGATIWNDSTAILYLKLGATASTTSFTVKLNQDDYYEVPFGYTGIIDGIWASDASGAARIVEFT